MTPEQKPETEARTPEQIAAEIVGFHDHWTVDATFDLKSLVADISTALAAKDAEIERLTKIIKERAREFGNRVDAVAANLLVLPIQEAEQPTPSSKEGGER